jgi:hypothetical protein
MATLDVQEVSIIPEKVRMKTVDSLFAIEQAALSQDIDALRIALQSVMSPSEYGIDVDHSITRELQVACDQLRSLAAAPELKNPVISHVANHIYVLCMCTAMDPSESLTPLSI